MVCKSSLNLEITRDTYAYYASASSKLVCPAEGRASSVKLTSGSNFWIARTGSRLRLERTEPNKPRRGRKIGRRINSIEQYRERESIRTFRTWTETRAGPLSNLSCYLHYPNRGQRNICGNRYRIFPPLFFSSNQRFVYTPFKIIQRSDVGFCRSTEFV